ncbi:MAG: hypothetical protein ABIV63_14675, partial [Caldimonas sp.]
TPRVTAREDVAPEDVDRAVELAQRNDPRHVAPGQLNRVVLRQRDVDLMVRYGARRFLHAEAQARLRPGLLLLQGSRAAPYGRWINVEVGLRQTGALPDIDHVRVGRLPVPRVLAIPLARAFAARHGVQADKLLAVEWIEHVSFAPDRLQVNYRLGADTTQRLRAALVAPSDQTRLRAYAERLAAVTRRIPGADVSVTDLLKPMFALAAERSAAGAPAVEENRAALLTLALFANHHPLALMVPAAATWEQPRPLNVTLQQRPDFPLHFLISAVIAAEAGTPLADAVGIWKEQADARAGGSGFSFNDIAADRAGTRLGELAVRDPARLQARIAAASDETAYMPDARDLPEFMPQAQFVARYGGVGAPAYVQMLAEIDRRIEALAVLR